MVPGLLVFGLRRFVLGVQAPALALRQSQLRGWWDPKIGRPRGQGTKYDAYLTTCTCVTVRSFQVRPLGI